MDSDEQNSGLSRGMLRQIAYNVALGRDQVLPSLSDVDFVSLIHEFGVYQLELEQQNDELRDTRGQLEEARDRFADLYDFAPVGYFTLTAEGTVAEANLTGCRLLGAERGKLLSTPFAAFVAQGSRGEYLRHLRQVIETDQAGSCVLALEAAGGRKIMARLESAPLREESGRRACRTALFDMSDLWEVQEKLRAALDERVVLMRELHHRVKNNLGVVSNLLQLAVADTASAETRKVCQDINTKVMAMSAIHAQVCSTGSLDALDMAEFLRELYRKTAELYGGASRVTVHFDLTDVRLPLDQAQFVGLAANELMSNVFKYAFPEGRTGEMRIHLSRDAAGGVRLEVADNGCGLPPGLDPRTLDSLGLRLVQEIVEQQLRGAMQIGAGPGTRIGIRFPPTPASPARDRLP